MENKTILKTWLIIIVVVTGGLILTIWSNTKSLKEVLDELNVTIELSEEYKVISNRKIIDDSRTIAMIYATSKDNILKIQIVDGLSEKEARDYTNNQRYLINSLFSRQKVPYPGPITNTLVCPKEYLPVIEEEDDSEYFKVFYYMYANDRLVFGGYDEGSLRYSMILAFIYCKEKKELFKIEYYTPKENTSLIHKNILKSFRYEG